MVLTELSCFHGTLLLLSVFKDKQKSETHPRHVRFRATLFAAYSLVKTPIFKTRVYFQNVHEIQNHDSTTSSWNELKQKIVIKNSRGRKPRIIDNVWATFKRKFKKIMQSITNSCTSPSKRILVYYLIKIFQKKM